jgi:hypothetical protein
MPWRVRELVGCGVQATDGPLGRVLDVCIDEQAWVVRLLAADTGPGPADRRVLICPASVRRITWPMRRVDVALTQEEVRTSPEIDTYRSIERRHELALCVYYGVPLDGSGDHREGSSASNGRRESRERALTEAARADGPMRSARRVIGYAVHGVDGEVGALEDFLVDGSTWAVRYLVVDSRRWMPGRRVLVPPAWVSWMATGVRVELDRSTIHRAPEYDPARPVDRAYQERLREHYGPPPARLPGGRVA